VPAEGFFAENLRTLLRSQKQLTQVVDEISTHSSVQEKAMKKHKRALDMFLQELHQQQLNQSVHDNSFEVRWSLQELENIVYDFVNYRQVPREFQAAMPLEVRKEDILKVQKADKDKEDSLPGMIRDLIIHDRGNSLFLGDSFANLPSPVNESQTIKQLFRPSDEDDKLRKKEKKDENVEIKIEGKSKFEDSDADKTVVHIDVKDIEQLVFASRQELLQAKAQYQEEDSYLNPSQVSADGYPEQVDSLLLTSLKQDDKFQQTIESSQPNNDTIKISYNDIYLGKND